MKIVETGGIRIGRNRWIGFNASIPLAKLEATESEIVLILQWKKWRFAREKIETLSFYDGSFSRGLKIEHSDSALPNSVVFGTFRCDEIQSALQKLGCDFAR